ncbi:monovalent cation/H(+) antiporter subunit G [Cnuibacter sp. UC19_7]|uniref:monovalent cation/H(+) antiporter subunit G n=1 Tax=Cnuibacter sp. UC19_7 TaxID=3350166 RepID=UPI00366CAF35
MNGLDFSDLGGWGPREVITAILVLLSAFLCFAAAVGLIRFRDVLTRLHAATKPQVLGLIAIVIDVAVSMPSVATVTLAVAIIGFQSLTAPLAAHMAGRAAYRTKHYDPALLLRDEHADPPR